MPDTLLWSVLLAARRPGRGVPRAALRPGDPACSPRSGSPAGPALAASRRLACLRRGSLVTADGLAAAGRAVGLSPGGRCALVFGASSVYAVGYFRDGEPRREASLAGRHVASAALWFGSLAAMSAGAASPTTSASMWVGDRGHHAADRLPDLHPRHHRVARGDVEVPAHLLGGRGLRLHRDAACWRPAAQRLGIGAPETLLLDEPAGHGGPARSRLAEGRLHLPAGRLRHQGGPGADAQLAARRPQPGAGAGLRDVLRLPAELRALLHPALTCRWSRRRPAMPAGAAAAGGLRAASRCWWRRSSSSSSTTSSGCSPTPASSTWASSPSGVGLGGFGVFGGAVSTRLTTRSARRWRSSPPAGWASMYGTHDIDAMTGALLPARPVWGVGFWLAGCWRSSASPPFATLHERVPDPQGAPLDAGRSWCSALFLVGARRRVRRALRPRDRGRLGRRARRRPSRSARRRGGRRARAAAALALLLVLGLWMPRRRSAARCEAAARRGRGPPMSARRLVLRSHNGEACPLRRGAAARDRRDFRGARRWRRSRAARAWSRSSAARRDEAIRVLLAVLAQTEPGMLSLCSTDVRDDYPSLTPDCPQAHWFEREIAEQWGVVPEAIPGSSPSASTVLPAGRDAWGRAADAILPA